MITITQERINQILCGVVKAGADVEYCIVETRNGARPPEGEFATIYWKSVQPLNEVRSDSWHTETETEYFENRLNPCLCTVQFSIFGDNAFEKCVQLNSFLQSENRLFDIDTLLGTSDIGTVNDISTAAGGRIQPRASFDFSFYVDFGRQYEMDYFIVDQTRVNFIK